MRRCDKCYCAEVCKDLDAVVRQKFGKEISLDEIEEIWQRLGKKCATWLDKKKAESIQKPRRSLV